MFFCSFIVTQQITICNYNNFLFDHIGMSFAFNESLYDFYSFHGQERRLESGRSLFALFIDLLLLSLTDD